MKLLGDRIFTTDYIDRQPLVGDDQYDKTAPCARNQPLWTETGRSPGTSLCLHCSIPCFLCHYCFHEIPRCMAVLKILRVHEHKTTWNEQSLLRIKPVISRFQIKSTIDIAPKYIPFFFPSIFKNIFNASTTTAQYLRSMQKCGSLCRAGQASASARHRHQRN